MHDDDYNTSDAMARTEDPQTSQDAAASVNVQQQEDWIEKLLRQAGDDGLTTAEMGELTGRTRDSFSPRMKPMERKGVVVRTGKRRNSPAGRPCTVWRLAPRPTPGNGSFTGGPH